MQYCSPSGEKRTKFRRRSHTYFALGQERPQRNEQEKTWFFVHEVADIIFLRNGASITAISKLCRQQRFTGMLTFPKL